MSKKPKPDITPALMKTSELAARVGVSDDTIREWQATLAHRIPPVVLKSGKVMYYSREDAMRWVAALKKGEVR